MGKYRITSPDGQEFVVNAPDGASQDDVMRYAREQWAAKRVPTLGDKAESVAKSARAGLMDPVLGVSQLISKGLRGISSLGGEYTQPVTDFLDREAKLYDRQIVEGNQDVESARQRAGFGGLDLTRLGANIVNPVNAIPAAGILGKSASLSTRVAPLAARGAAAGAASAAIQPVANTENYLTEKLAQIGFGGLSGGVLTPVVSKLATAIGQRVNQVGNMVKRQNADDVINGAFAEAGLRRADYTQDQMKALKAEVESALKVGKLVNPAAVARKADFDALGMRGTSGQITRDPTQYTDEMNLSKLAGIGEPLRGRMNEQSRRLSELMDNYASGADDAVVTGQKAIDRLKSVDEQMRSRVSGMYTAARQSAEAADSVPMTGLAQDIGRILDDFEGSVPTGLINRFKRYGFLGGEQKKVFDMIEAEKLLQATNDYGNVTDRATQTALSQIRNALKRSITEGAQDGGPFAEARLAAAARFKAHDAVPALDDVSRGAALPDDFFAKYVMRAPVKQVKDMAGMLDGGSRDSIRKMIADDLRRAAFGANPAGDAKFSPVRYSEKLRKIGDERLGAFFDPQEIAQLKRIGRVAAFKESRPANSAVNESNTTSALYNLARATGSGVFDQPLLNFIPAVAEKARQANLLSYSLKDGVGPVLPALGQAGRNRVGLLTDLVPITSGAFLGPSAQP